MIAELPMRSEVQQDVHDDLLFYTQVCDPRYRPGALHQFLADILQDAAAGKKRRIMLNTPPQHGKSRMTAVEFPTWLLGRNPRLRVVVASYGQALSNRASREARARIESAQYQWLFPNTKPAHWVVEEWGTTAGGSYRAVGIGGALTGHSADVVIIDDPFKDHQEAHSPTQREAVWDWFLSVAMTRLAPDGVVIIIMTRWHIDDLCGRLLEPKRLAQMRDMGFDQDVYEQITLPGIAKENDPMGRAPGEALWPEKYPVRWLQAQMALLGSYKSAALYEGHPVQKGGNYVSIDDFQIIKPHLVPEGMFWCRFWDLASTKADDIKKNDPDETCGVKGAIRVLPELMPNGRHAEELYLADMSFWKAEWPKSREKIRVTAEAERILIGVEVVAGFKTAAQNLREVLPQNVKMIEVGVDKEKLTRALPWIAMTEQKRVFLVEGEWNVPFMLQAEAFPNGNHDDRVDAVSGVYQLIKAHRPILLA